MALAASKGCIVQGFEDTPDPNVSVYAGGNLLIKGNIFSEVEGSVVVNGNVQDSFKSLAGKVIWGMGFQPVANSTMLAVGGNLTTKSDMKATYVGGNARIGGTASKLKISTDSTLKADGRSDEEIKGWVYTNQKNARIITNLGRTAALQVDTDGDGRLDMDYNDYTSKTLIPLSDSLNALAETGTVSYGHATPDIPNYGWGVAYNNSQFITDTRPNPYIKVSIKNEGLLTFTGDGQKHRQVFRLDMNKVEQMASQLGTNKAWSLDFRNIPDGQAIVINVTGRSDITWWPGWRIRVNGKDYSTAINRHDESVSRYRSIASRIMWNFPTAANLRLEGGPITEYAQHPQPEGQGSWYYATHSGQTNRGVLFPGSVLLPRGSMYDLGDTNGRILVGKDLTFDIWEHHNAPWIGFDEPQCFAIDGKTSATLS